MIKKSQYVQLLLLLLLIFILFLMTASSISFQGDVVLPVKKGADKLRAATGSSMDSLEDPAQEDYIVVIQGDNTVGGENVSCQLTCLKKKFRYYKTMDEVPLPVRDYMKVLILCSGEIEGYYSYDDIVGISRQGTDIIFAVLPEREELTQEWRELLGIRYIGDRYTQKGVVALDGFLVGGRSWYEDYRLRALRIKTNSSCKTFLAGINDEKAQEQLRNEDATDIIWRTICNNSRIFVINGNFFSDMSHIGILGAVLSELSSDYLYPVINARMLLIEDAPYLSNENEAEMEKRYARNSRRFLQEIAIPGILSLSMALEIQPQFFGTQYFRSFSDALRSDAVSFLHKELVKIGGDIQLSADKNQKEKLFQTMEVFEEVAGKKMTSLFFGDYEKVEEAAVMEELSYHKNQVSSIIHRWSDLPEISIKGEYVYIPMMTEGYQMDGKLLFSFDGAASSLGLITHGISMETIIYPQSEEDDWASAYKDFSAYYYTACQKYSWMDGMDAEGLEQRVRQYLVMEPEISWHKKSIHLKVEHLYTQGFFILKTTGKKIREMSSGSFKKLEEGIYLLTVTEPETEIFLKEKK